MAALSNTQTLPGLHKNAQVSALSTALACSSPKSPPRPSTVYSIDFLKSLQSLSRSLPPHFNTSLRSLLSDRRLYHPDGDTDVVDQATLRKDFPQSASSFPCHPSLQEPLKIASESQQTRLVAPPGLTRSIAINNQKQSLDYLPQSLPFIQSEKDSNLSWSAAIDIAFTQPLFNHGTESLQSDPSLGPSSYMTELGSSYKDMDTPRFMGYHQQNILASSNNFVESNEILEEMDEGCPVLKVPRVLYNGMQGNSQDFNPQGTMTLPKRQWKKQCQGQLDSRMFFASHMQGHFMVMSYNLLAPFYCTQSKYPLTDPQYLEWEVRRRQILDEITFYAPDFVCLQVCSYVIDIVGITDIRVCYTFPLGTPTHWLSRSLSEKEERACCRWVCHLLSNFTICTLGCSGFCL